MRTHRFNIGLVGAWLFAAVCSCAFAQAPASNEDSIANVTVMAMPGDTFTNYEAKGGDLDAEYSDDQVSFTYRRVIPRSQANRDVAAFDAIRKVDTVQFYDADGNPINDDTGNPETIVIYAKNIFPVGTTHFDIEPFVLALKSYKRMHLHFQSRPGAPFTGLREFHNQYVHVSFAQAPRVQWASNSSTPQPRLSSSFDYFITVDNPNFTQLNLPTDAPQPTRLNAASNGSDRRLRLIVFVVGVWAVLVVAGLTGWGVYRKLKRIAT